MLTQRARSSSRVRTPSKMTGESFEQERARLLAVEAQQRAVREEERRAQAEAEAARNRPGIISRAATKVSECIGDICSTFAPTGIADVKLQRTKICEWGLTELATEIFKKDFLSEFERVKSDTTVQKEYRNIWEFGQSPTVQCNSTILDVMATQDNKECWLCGGFIRETPEYPRDPRMPSCDHILPIAQAVMFLGLFKSENVMKAVVGEALGYIPPAKDSALQKFREAYAAVRDSEVINLEYGWSHLGCNLVKNDAVFIRLHPPSAAEGKVVWEVDTDAIRTYLRTLRNSKYTETYRSNWSDVWIDNRVSVMSNYKLANIVNTLNARPNESTINTLYKKSMERCTLSADPRGAEYLNMQITLTAWEIFGERIPAKIDRMFNIQKYLSIFLRALGFRGPKLKGEGRTKKLRGKKRNKKTLKVKKH